MIDQRNWCLKCGALEDERALKECSNPVWHLPNFRESEEEAARREDE